MPQAAEQKSERQNNSGKTQTERAHPFETNQIEPGANRGDNQDYAEQGAVGVGEAKKPAPHRVVEQRGNPEADESLDQESEGDPENE